VLADVISSWQYVHQQFNSSNEHSVKAYMDGAIDDLEFIRRDVNLWKTNGQLLFADELEEILSRIPLMPGASELFSNLHHKQIDTVIVSAGLDILAQRIAATLGIPYVYANGLLNNEDNRLTGEGILRVKLMYKDEAVRAVASELGISPDEMIAVGNSCFDIPMMSQCGLGIAFNPSDDCIRTYADEIIEEKNLASLIPVIEKYVEMTTVHLGKD
jgi:phosphoserine phosphatase